MKRSVVNSIFFAVLFSTVINWAVFLIVREISLWNVLVIIILFILIKPQNYLYIKNDKTYFRRVPFFRGIPIENLKSVEDLRILDSSSNIVSLWHLIKLKNQRQESYE